MTSADRAMIARLIAREVDPRKPDEAHHDTHDPGGVTKYGISQRAYPQLDIESLTYDEAVDLYWRDYLVKPRISRIPDPVVREQVFDHGVNRGQVSAIRLLQSQLPTVPQTGVIAAITLRALKFTDPIALRDAYRHAREADYRRLKQFPHYGNGWLNRVTRCCREAHAALDNPAAA